MPFHDPRLTRASESRQGRPLQISWSAVWGGALIGQATLFLLCLLGASLAGVERGRASIFGDRLGYLGLGASGVSVAAMVIAAFLGAYVVVRICGERRRREAFLHASIAWALSSVALGALAATAAGGAGLSPRTLATAAGALALTFVFSLLGGALASSNSEGRPFAEGQRPPTQTRLNLSDFEVKPSRPTVIPPLH